MGIIWRASKTRLSRKASSKLHGHRSSRIALVVGARTRASIATLLLCVSGMLNGAPDPSAAGSDKAIYAEHCTSCHGASLQGSAHAPPLAGSQFLDKWGAATPAALATYTRASMPPGDNSMLRDEDIFGTVRHVIAWNQKSAADDSDAERYALLDEVANSDPEEESGWVNFSKAETIDEQARTSGEYVSRPLSTFEAVTDQSLREPPPGDWLSWRRTLNGHGFSPLTQINRDTVGELKLAWTLAMHDGSNQVTPLVRDGVMFLTHPGNRIQAVDAASGDVIWEYAYEFPPGAKTLGGPVRNIAIYQDKLFLSTYDAALVAIDARTGKQVWRTQKADYRQAYTHTSGPIIGSGVVLSGINGCELFTTDGCFITGHDPNTGKELWRTSTIALPGTPEDASWGGQAQELRGGGDTWIAGSYDPKLELFFIGTSQAKPWVAASRGMRASDAALYTNSTLALDPKSGDIVWHYQHMPGETIDMEVGFERVLVDLRGQKLLFTIGKDGLLWKLNRETGAFIALTETLPQNIYADIDRDTGKLRYREDILNAGIGDTVQACPGIYGGHNWQALAYDPARERLFIPLHQLCSDMIGRAVELKAGGGGYGGDSRTYPMPGVDGQLGRLAAFDANTLEEVWSQEQRSLFLTGTLATASGLVFIGDLDRYFHAFDADTGEQLWRTRLGAPLHGYPVTYTANGRQYVAVPTGIGVFRALTATLLPDVYQPSNGQALYVFELPSAPSN
ncbi:MAG: PQQ-binding-like beta-propeller repeat protein [Congregibacter sp.]